MFEVNGDRETRASVCFPTMNWIFLTLPRPTPVTRTPTLDQLQAGRLRLRAALAWRSGFFALRYLTFTPRVTTPGASRAPAGSTGDAGSPTPGEPGCSITGSRRSRPCTEIWKGPLAARA